jgi:ribosome-associated protein
MTFNLPPHKRDFTAEFNFKTSRSSGPGGQNVNKTNTKVLLSFSVLSSALLTELEKGIVLEKLEAKINSEKELLITSEASRSQLKNKEDAQKKFYKIIKDAFFVKKRRKETKPSKSVLLKREKSKKINAEKKELRKKII